MGPAVPPSSQLRDETSLARTVGLPEDVVPDGEHDAQERCDVPVGDGPVVEVRVVRMLLEVGLGESTSTERDVDLPLDIGTESVTEQHQSRGDLLDRLRRHALPRSPIACENPHAT